MNDNHGPRHADSFASMAERREWVQSTPGDNREHKAWPTLVTLQRSIARSFKKSGIDALADRVVLQSGRRTIALRKWSEMMQPAQMNILAEKEFSEETETYELLTAEPERELRVRPSAKYIEKKTWLNESTTVHGDGTIEHAPAGKLAITRRKSGHWWRCGDWKFNASLELIAFKDNGKWKSPTNCGTEWGEAKHCADLKPASEISERDPQTFEDEQARLIDAESLRARLGESAKILDFASGPSTAQEIGETLGFSGKTAERVGIRMTYQAIDQFSKLIGDNMSLDCAQTA